MARNSKPVIARPATLGNRFMPARFLLFLVLLPAAFAALNALRVTADWKDAAALAFDVSALAFLVSLAPILRDSEIAAIRRHAAENNANRWLVLGITSLLMLVVMAAVSGEIDGAKHHNWLAMAKLVVTLLLIWLFANVVYALHYAHAYYSSDPGTGKDTEGLDFPGTQQPGYGEFVYFAFTLGMTFQTSDVQITAPAVRRVALAHGFAAFVFSLGVIAFTINTLGGS
jgi:uncharacterized membrane protein